MYINVFDKRIKKKHTSRTTFRHNQECLKETLCNHSVTWFTSVNFYWIISVDVTLDRAIIYVYSHVFLSQLCIKLTNLSDYEAYKSNVSDIVQHRHKFLSFRLHYV